MPIRIFKYSFLFVSILTVLFYKTNAVFDMVEFKPEWSGLRDQQISVCGGRLIDLFGELRYNSQLPNERCVWVLRSPNSTDYFITLIQAPGTSHLTFSAFSLGVDSVKHISPKTTGLYELMDNFVAIITFETSALTVGNDGFALTYVARHDGRSSISSEFSRDTVVNSEKSGGYLRHPTWGKRYHNSELSTFLFPLPGNQYNQACKTEVGFVINELEGDESSCVDHIQLFTYHPAPESKWENVTKLCNSPSSNLTFSTDDLLFATFVTDESVEKSGFEIFHSWDCVTGLLVSVKSE